MDATFDQSFTQRLSRIAEEVEQIQTETDQQPLQVGDRTLIDRSLDIIRQETSRLLQFAADSRLDPTKQ